MELTPRENLSSLTPPFLFFDFPALLFLSFRSDSVRAVAFVRYLNKVLFGWSCPTESWSTILLRVGPLLFYCQNSLYTVNGQKKNEPGNPFHKCVYGPKFTLLLFFRWLLPLMRTMITPHSAGERANQLLFYDYGSLIADLRYFNLTPLELSTSLVLCGTRQHS